MSPRVAVAAPGAQALEAGLAVGSEGGTAVDAALAAAFVAGATEPGIVNLMGGAYVTVWPAGGDPVVLDGNVEMPGRGVATERFGHGVVSIDTDYGGGVTMHAGAGSVATPGVVPAFALAARRWGRLPFARLVEPAALACREGYPLGRASATYLEFVRDSLFALDPEARRLVTRDDGSALGAGETTHNRPLAATLEALGQEGPRLFTHGDVARAMVASLADDGLVTAADLAAYEVVEREPVRLHVGAWDVALNPPPAIGGVVLAVMLRELARRATAQGGFTWSDVVQVQHAVLTHRIGVLDTAPDLDAAGRAMLADASLAGLSSSASTAHVSAVDAEGTACAITFSSGYHSGTCVPGTGLLLNNCLGETELNRRGLHALAPGTRLASNMAPTVARSGDGGVLAAGSPGADRITSALVQVLGQTMLHGADPRTAVEAPRLHVRVRLDGSTSVEHEPGDGLAEAASSAGLAAHAYPGPHMYFGGVGLALVHADGRLEAHGDPRRASATGSR
ncbi:gamma-glutamyltransferase [Nocardioides acrostichi]|uniref:Gamma-glutamyltransferase n=1 Tax=Nocardioides acrostichi TaxID=2784339 RepID=A0A930V422_9ACTN|nr:gamma-glutamyltransferase [Nocardioides acrostichi]MBF4163471.1 gamma-glutamyltransferase [Nocardioides acrostichi]